ncbi:flagellar brake protein [Photobacterium sanctipauli]|uniref:Flagellar brake protein n=1 Tax=Photobacterium sanctipauli TaxID=1342794 RepID=A0A2T3NIH7_9GAMM|nr:PilZ domain-containing protein [Photobacterium sanctipauli]PSW14832.1 flagellar brake protein [Photobacterium sanctipauli]
MIQQGRSFSQHAAKNETWEEVVLGEQAIERLKHGSGVTLSVKTPLGRLYRVETTFIGTNSQSELFFELPSVLNADLSNYFDAGFKVTVKAISDKGEGAIIQFQSIINNVAYKPFRLLSLSMPHNAHLRPLRNEPRFDVKLDAVVVGQSRELAVKLQDLSANGCRFITDYNGPSFSEAMTLNLVVTKPDNQQQFSLTGTVKNHHKKGSTKQYGLQFDTRGAIQVKALMTQLIFDGSHLSFKKAGAN